MPRLWPRTRRSDEEIRTRDRGRREKDEERNKKDYEEGRKKGRKEKKPMAAAPADPGVARLGASVSSLLLLSSLPPFLIILFVFIFLPSGNSYQTIRMLHIRLPHFSFFLHFPLDEY
jgi:hypothetical protein